MVEVVPAIIPKSFEDLKEKVALVEPFVRRVQVDVMDGKFAPSTSWPYEKEEEPMLPNNKSIFYEIDMMMYAPEEVIHDWIHAGARSLIVHIESTNVLDRILFELSGKDIEIGVALSPNTPNEALGSWVDKVSFVQCMGNQKIGHHGVPLDVHVLKKVASLREQYPELIIGVDIGVNLETAPKLVAAGANKLISGSTIFKSDNIGKTIAQLKSLI
jgi:ribulose-phosphate 3-epimerase|tara:strand:- start:52779 stop:53423 length:645 start_codon:yes stop_codon:yes gene_type:complete